MHDNNGSITIFVIGCLCNWITKNIDQELLLVVSHIVLMFFIFKNLFDNLRSRVIYLTFNGSIFYIREPFHKVGRIIH